MSRRPPRQDLVVVGGGTGGLVSAFVAAGMGARVTLVERDAHPGGDCLWTGCVPSKSLLAAAETAHAVRGAARFGLDARLGPVDLAAVMRQVREVQQQIAPHDSVARLEAEGVRVVRGAARFVGRSALEAGGVRLRFRKAIVATGSAPVLPPVPGLAAAHPLTTDTVWNLDVLPEHLVIIGGGPIGCELGQAFARLGARVTVVDLAPRLLAREEPDAAVALAAALRADGVLLRLGASVTQVEALAEGRARLRLDDGGADLDADAILVAAGRAPRTGGLGLDRAGVELEDGGAIRVDGTLRTSARRVLAVGDVTGGPAFTHVAAHHARVAAVNALLGTRRRADRAALPRVTYTDPEIAHVGLTEAEARERWGGRVVLARTPAHAELDRVLTARAPAASALLIGDPKGRLVGASVVGRAAGETIAELTAWITAHAKIDAVSTTVHAYPTFGETAARAADEHLRARYATPQVRALLRPVLALARHLPHRP